MFEIEKLERQLSRVASSQAVLLRSKHLSNVTRVARKCNLQKIIMWNLILLNLKLLKLKSWENKTELDVVSGFCELGRASGGPSLENGKVRSFSNTCSFFQKW